MYNIEEFDFNKHIDGLIATAKSIEKNKVTILTGPNGYGKSFVRKLLGQLHSKYEFPKVASFSMETRTCAKEQFSALRSVMMDKRDDATSNHTCYGIESLLKTANRYFVVDEPEIGMGKEMLLGLIHNLHNTFEVKKANNDFTGVTYITHSEFFIENMPHDVFINLQGLTYEEWKNREIIPVSPKKLDKWCSEMNNAINKRLKH